MAAEPTFGKYSRQNSESTSDQSPESCKNLGQIELAQKAALRVNSTVSRLVLHGVQQSSNLPDNNTGHIAKRGQDRTESADGHIR